jgi:hypothetical protein
MQQKHKESFVGGDRMVPANSATRLSVLVLTSSACLPGRRTTRSGLAAARQAHPGRKILRFLEN